MVISSEDQSCDIGSSSLVNWTANQRNATTIISMCNLVKIVSYIMLYNTINGVVTFLP